jgi:two-component system, NtrC family, sensor histidine kinase KinB
MSIRFRLWLSFAPLLLLLAALGGGFIYSLGIVGNRIEAILQENYRSVDAMTGLHEAAERIDSSFRFALVGRQDAPSQFTKHWNHFEEHLEVERNNITEPGEKELVEQLTELSDRYRALGNHFFESGRAVAERNADYFHPDGSAGPLLETFRKIKEVSGAIRRLNQESMEAASQKARETAGIARRWTSLGLLFTLAATGMLAWRTGRTILRPVEELTRSVIAVSEGKFEQMVTPASKDEIGNLVTAFNRMTAQLRDLRQTHVAKLLRAQQASQAAIDAFPDPVLVVDQDCVVEMANPAARRILGVLADGDLAGHVWNAPDRLRAPLTAALQLQQPFLTNSFDEAVTYRIGNEDRSYIPQILPVRDPYGGTLGAAVVLNDVTRFRLLDEFKTDLVATASNELKTPLAGLRLAVHLLLEETVGPINDKQTGLLIDARENTERLVKIVDHLLTLARLEHGREQLILLAEEPEKLLHDAVERVEPVLNGRKITFEIDPDQPIPAVAVDAQRIGHAIDNLLVNAATYTESGGQITLSAKGVAPNRVEISIRDTGVGIPHEFLPHVFDKFFRIPGQSRGQGTGLGLAIVKEIVVAHGGGIVCESEPGKGTTFRISLPVWTHQGMTANGVNG